VVRDAGFAQALSQRFEEAFAVSREVAGPAQGPGLRGWARRVVVAWAANLYLKIAGITGRY
jgi:cardiolipin synthase